MFLSPQPSLQRPDLKSASITEWARGNGWAGLAKVSLPASFLNPITTGCHVIYPFIHNRVVSAQFSILSSYNKGKVNHGQSSYIKKSMSKFTRLKTGESHLYSVKYPLFFFRLHI